MKNQNPFNIQRTEKKAVETTANFTANQALEALGSRNLLKLTVPVEDGQVIHRQVGVEDDEARTGITEPCIATKLVFSLNEETSKDAKAENIAIEKVVMVQVYGNTISCNEMTGEPNMVDDKPVVDQTDQFLMSFKLEVSSRPWQSNTQMPAGKKFFSLNGKLGTPKVRITRKEGGPIIRTDFSKLGNLSNLIVDCLVASKNTNDENWKLIRESATEVLMPSEKANETAKIVIGAVESGEKLFD